MEPATIPTTQRTLRLSRPAVIDRLRAKLKTLPKEDECLCQAAARLGVYCKGFSRLSEREFREKFSWIAVRHPQETRKGLEELAGLYHLGRQEATHAELCCDVETREHSGCDGWNGFDNHHLEELHLSLLGTPVRIV